MDTDDTIDIGALSPSSKDAVRERYQNQGYVVIKNCIPTAKIDLFLEEYEKIKRNPAFVYYAQSTHVATRPQLNAYGYIQESMQNASRLAFYPKFCQAMKSCLYEDRVAQTLTWISGYTNHVAWQNMFFDQSTGTIDHQDSWYLDTEPPGNLTGVWYALEDIRLESGAFFVIPGSHKLGLISRQNFPSHEDFVAEVMRLTEEQKLRRKPMLLQKGDILLWHPYLIHGAFSCQDASLSRKSFTSHFYPYGLAAKDTESQKKLSIYDHSKPLKTRNPHLFTAYRFPDVVYSLLVYGLYLKRVMLVGRKSLSMRREDYRYS
ncbi:MAG: phytanoyl-CoA dioxygenase family protein [Oscillatoriales cyanobacterium SM2_1_8]|nr:phytanoyl-CoA dioxygenase family protein [Oscillatoriales cyanobacterium SM2_1_8]